MQGVIEEKNSKIVEVIVSTVKPFQFMLGKVLGVATVGLAQILIWIVLMTAIYTTASALLIGKVESPLLKQVENVQQEEAMAEAQDNPMIQKVLGEVANIPVTQILINFVFYFIGGYLLYGALFAAVGSAVDTPADAQQFMLPIMLPIVIGFAGMSMFVFDDPNGSISFWLFSSSDQG